MKTQFGLQHLVLGLCLSLLVTSAYASPHHSGHSHHAKSHHGLHRVGGHHKGSHRGAKSTHGSRDVGSRSLRSEDKHSSPAAVLAPENESEIEG